MPQSGSNKGPWIVAGAIVLAGLLVIIALVILLGGNDSNPKASPSQSPTMASSKSPRPHRSPKPSGSPSESPSPSPSESASPSPTTDDTALIRVAVEKQANRDRPGELKHIGQVEYYTDKVGCAQTGQAASTFVRFSVQPKAAIYIFCKGRAHWTYSDGPIYGE